MHVKATLRPRAVVGDIVPVTKSKRGAAPVRGHPRAAGGTKKPGEEGS